MILYTTMPQELIFQTTSAEYAKQQLVYYDGIPLLVRETEAKEYEVIRNLSTNPQHFLQAKYSPGMRVLPTTITS
jgi:hypothetical protein